MKSIELHGLRFGRTWKILLMVALIFLGPVLPPPTGAEKIEDEISGQDNPQGHSFKLPLLDPGSVGWEISLLINDPTSLDIDLEVHTANPQNVRTALQLCRSDGSTSIERCRIKREDLPQKPGPPEVWLRVVPASKNGATAYTLDARVLKGPNIRSTKLYADDAKKDLSKKTPSTEGTFLWGDYLQGEQFGVFNHLYRIKPIESSEGPESEELEKLLVTLNAEDGQTNLNLGIYNDDGRLISKPDVDKPNQVRLIPIDDTKEYFVLVKLADWQNISDDPGYELQIKYFGGFNPELAFLQEKRRLDLGSAQVIRGTDVRYRIKVPTDTLALILLEGEGSELSAYTGSDFKETQKAIRLDAEKQVLHLGKPFMNSHVILEGFGKDRDFLIRINKKRGKETDREKKIIFGKGRRITMQEVVDDYLVRFSPGDAKPVSLDFGFFGRAKPKQIEKSVDKTMFSYRLGSTKAFSATIDNFTPTRMFYVALCRKDGTVIDIAPNRVTWDPDAGRGEGNGEDLFLVVFLDPREENQSPDGLGRFKITFQKR